MVEIKPNCLYSRDDLAALLRPVGVDVDMFIARIGARKVFKKLWFGEDILEAIRKAPALGEGEDGAKLPAARNGGNRRRKSKRAEPGPLERIAGGKS